ncbi:hypothetical protein H2203_005816 [Taxawa tesnikishii (nom. ined.)]|nr:hypothetical protein H2203_005816 [Dothideales sp. JES 119]
MSKADPKMETAQLLEGFQQKEERADPTDPEAPIPDDTAFAVNQTPPAEPEAGQQSGWQWKRNHSVFGSIAGSRKSSVSVSRKGSETPNRAGWNRNLSVASNRSNGSASSRRMSWFQSMNPDIDSECPEIPPVPSTSETRKMSDQRKMSFNAAATIRRMSMISNTNTDASSIPSPTTTRRPSYTPRVAASSFLRTTTPMSQESRNNVRRMSLAAGIPGPSFVPPEHYEEWRKEGTERKKNETSSNLEKYQMNSLAGVAEIEEEMAPDAMPAAPVSAPTLQVPKPPHKRIDSHHEPRTLQLNIPKIHSPSPTAIAGDVSPTASRPISPDAAVLSSTAVPLSPRSDASPTDTSSGVNWPMIEQEGRHEIERQKALHALESVAPDVDVSKM